ncbi:hypothetical protein HZQ67_13960 [Elizabethkingia anophelis]|nr:hypothetical protein [Elizabethkingia anophelis]
METPKEKAIKAAYGDMWIYMSSFPQARKIALENEGWVFITHLPSTIDRTLFDFQHGDSICRPKSLSGIENNRGWIEFQGNHPKESKWYWIKTNNDMLVAYWASHKNIFVDNDNSLYFNAVTHYQPIETQKPPIF